MLLAMYYWTEGEIILFRAVWQGFINQHGGTKMLMVYWGYYIFFSGRISRKHSVFIQYKRMLQIFY